MPRERKSSIPPGSVLGDVELPQNDLLTRVIHNDAATSGRHLIGTHEPKAPLSPAPPLESTPTPDDSHEIMKSRNSDTTSTKDNENITPRNSDTTKSRNHENVISQDNENTTLRSSENTISQNHENVTPRKRDATKSQGDKTTVSRNHENVISQIREIRETPMRHFNLQLPEAMGDWVIDYAHAHRKGTLPNGRKVNKQEVVAYAVELLMARVLEQEEGK